MLSPKLDVVFHMLFGVQENEKITKGLINGVIQEKVESIKLGETPYLWGEHAEDKVGIIDVRAVVNGNTHVDIEMQMINQENIEKRILYYWSKLYSNQLKRGENYNKLQRTICILFINEEIKKLENLPMQTTWEIIETKERKIILTNDLELNIIELPKQDKSECNQELKKWIMFLQNPESEAVRKMAQYDEEIKEAVEKLEEISSDEAKIRIAELREKYILDQNTNISGAEERGKRLGRAEGERIGQERGERIGEKKKAKEIAKKMLKQKIDVQIIIDVTGLTKEEIENL